MAPKPKTLGKVTRLRLTPELHARLKAGGLTTGQGGYQETFRRILASVRAGNGGLWESSPSANSQAFANTRTGMVREVGRIGRARHLSIMESERWRVRGGMPAFRNRLPMSGGV